MIKILLVPHYLTLFGIGWVCFITSRGLINSPHLIALDKGILDILTILYNLKYKLWYNNNIFLYIYIYIYVGL